MAMDSKDMSAQVVFHVGSVWAVWTGIGLLASVDAHMAVEALLAGTTTEQLAAHWAGQAVVGCSLACPLAPAHIQPSHLQQQDSLSNLPSQSARARDFTSHSATPDFIQQ
ncbi:hypothetical protein Pcinc_014512 [Petrolisthes cinctipes]|uniref:Uncharacterized protein n=1 Tax=Petrolisthes cinctipes TaxID=88211 RepID=A0AAE1FV93_PETCI|nr:hypothetical protein Pcinc_014512 [Petrolisthes cinctipes]